MRFQLRLLMFTVMALLLAACSHDRVEVQIPPRARVDGIRTIAVLPFDSLASDPGLAIEFEQRIIQQLRQSAWYDRVIEARVDSLLGTLQGSAFELSTPAARREARDRLQADAVIIGAATYYFEDVSRSAAECRQCNDPDRRSWSVAQTTQVSVTLNARMINLHTGETVYSRISTGDDRNYTTHSIRNYRGAEPPPASAIPQVSRQQVPFTRQIAIDRAVRDFVRDLLPTYQWRRVEQ